jgi:hypothetical protein
VLPYSEVSPLLGGGPCRASGPALTFGNPGGSGGHSKKSGRSPGSSKKIYEKASLVNVDSVRIIFLVNDDPMKYHRFAGE